jgi:hypothetical protein
MKLKKSMKLKNSPYPLIRIPNDIQIPLYLIKEELKCRKLFHILEEAGMTDCDFEPHLDSLIFRIIGLDDDNVSDKYFDIMERRSKKIEGDNDHIMKQAIKAYHEIIAIKKVSH